MVPAHTVCAWEQSLAPVKDHSLPLFGKASCLARMDIRALDHLIVGDNNGLSFAERGLPQKVRVDTPRNSCTPRAP